MTITVSNIVHNIVIGLLLAAYHGHAGENDTPTTQGSTEESHPVPMMSEDVNAGRVVASELRTQKLKPTTYTWVQVGRNLTKRDRVAGSYMMKSGNDTLNVENAPAFIWHSRRVKARDITKAYYKCTPIVASKWDIGENAFVDTWVTLMGRNSSKLEIQNIITTMKISPTIGIDVLRKIQQATAYHPDEYNEETCQKQLHEYGKSNRRYLKENGKDFVGDIDDETFAPEGPHRGRQLKEAIHNILKVLKI
ncbi:hypothetical protein FOL47_008757 [Perkinsus chesapeaki]|uniref:Slowmo n=1 Tax=Perkinsus chesapeaki TaxID=330153 RepID=A0A7J6LC58_PERCH|nr:hypothetical protein FOL47_008757 [Perkinsus chesapeaki]